MSMFCAVRGGLGLAQLVAPGLVGRVFGLVPDPSMRRMTRLLGARHLTQAATSAPEPSAAVLALGVEVDLLHSISMIALAGWDRRRRRAALTSAAAAAGFAAAGVLATRQARRHPVPPADARRAVQLRNRVAVRLARHLLPAQIRAADYPSVASS